MASRFPARASCPGSIPCCSAPRRRRPGRLRQLSTPRGELLVQVLERVPAAPAALARERENVRRVVLNRRIYDHVEELRARARIEILRPELAERPPAPPRI